MMIILLITVGIVLLEVYYIGKELIKIRRLESDSSIVHGLKETIKNLEETIKIRTAEKIEAQNEVNGINYLWNKTAQENTKLRFDLSVAEQQLHYLAQKALHNQTNSPKEFWQKQETKLPVEANFL